MPNRPPGSAGRSACTGQCAPATPRDDTSWSRWSSGTTSPRGSADNDRLMALAEEGVELSRRVGDPRAESYALGMVGFASLQLGDLDWAALALEEALGMFRELGDDWGAAHILTHLAVAPIKRGISRWPPGTRRRPSSSRAGRGTGSPPP